MVSIEEAKAIVVYKATPILQVLALDKPAMVVKVSTVEQKLIVAETELKRYKLKYAILEKSKNRGSKVLRTVRLNRDLLKRFASKYESGLRKKIEGLNGELDAMEAKLEESTFDLQNADCVLHHAMEALFKMASRREFAHLAVYALARGELIEDEARPELGLHADMSHSIAERFLMVESQDADDRFESLEERYQAYKEEFEDERELQGMKPATDTELHDFMFRRCGLIE